MKAEGLISKILSGGMLYWNSQDHTDLEFVHIVFRIELPQDFHCNTQTTRNLPGVIPTPDLIKARLALPHSTGFSGVFPFQNRDF